MISKTSCGNTVPYGKYILENIRQRGWLAALSALTLFLLLPVYTTMRIDNFLSLSGQEYIETLRERFPLMINGESSTYAGLVILLLAVVCGVSGFAYLHQSDMTDFFHSFPLKRSQWFQIAYLSGVILFLIPYLLCSLGTLLIAASRGVLVASNVTASVLAVLGGIVGFLLCYHTAILAMMLTGKLISGVLASFALLVYAYMITTLSENLISSYFATFSAPLTDGMTIGSLLSTALSPYELYEHMITLSPEVESLRFLGAALVILVLLWLSAWMLYRHRALEMAGNALAYPKCGSVIKVLITVPTALYIGFFIQSFYYSNGQTWIIAASLAAAVLLCGVIEFIYTLDLRQLGRRKIASLVSVFLVAGILGVLRLDVFGYDSWLPESSKIESMALYSDSYMSYFTYPNDDDPYMSEAYRCALLNQEAQRTDFDAIYKLAQEGVEHVREDITTNSIYEDSLRDYCSIILRFNKKNGTSVYRTYAVSRESLVDCLEELSQNEVYRKNLFPIFHVENENVQGIILDDLLSNKQMDLTEEQRDALLNAYRLDVLQTDIATLQYADPIGSLTLRLKEDPAASTDTDSYPQELYGFYVYETYTNTLTLLDEYGDSPHTEIDPADVLQMTHFIYSDASVALADQYTDTLDARYSNNNAISTATVTDPEEMKSLLQRVCYSAPGIAGGREDYTESIEVLLRGDTGTRTFLLQEE